MKLNTVKKAIDVIKNDEISFRVSNVKTKFESEQDFESADSISHYTSESTSANIVFDKPGYDNFGLEVTKTTTSQSISYAEIDENGVDFNNSTSESKEPDTYYNVDLFSKDIELGDDSISIAYDLLNGNGSMVSDIDYSDGVKVNLGSTIERLLDKPIDNYLRKEHGITFDSFEDVRRVIDKMDLEKKIKEPDANIDDIATEAYKEIRASLERKKEPLGFNLMG